MVAHIIQAKPLLAGEAQGKILLLSEPLSLWGGLNPETGEIIDRHHPQSGNIVTDKILVMPSGRGSSSATSILLEAIRLDTAPSAIILAEMDGILVLGSVVAQEIYQKHVPILVVQVDDYDKLKTEQIIKINTDGTIYVS